MWQFFAAWLAVALFLVSNNTKAADWEVQLHQGTTLSTQGYSFAVSDSFARQSPFYWHASYTELNEVVHEWNDDDQYIPLTTLDASIGYRFASRSFNARAKGLSFEVQLGAAVSLQKSEYIFPQDENLPSTTLIDKGDVSPLITTSFNYNISRFSAVTFGVKHLTDAVKLGDVTSIYIGFSYQIGNRQYGL